MVEVAAGSCALPPGERLQGGLQTPSPWWPPRRPLPPLLPQWRSVGEVLALAAASRRASHSSGALTSLP